MRSVAADDQLINSCTFKAREHGGLELANMRTANEWLHQVALR